MILDFFVRYPVFPIALWAIMYISDYYLTLAGARLRRAMSDKLAFSGSYELTPGFEEDVDNQRIFSTRFIWSLGSSAILLFAFWLLAVRLAGLPGLFELLWGAWVLPVAAIHLRHAANISRYRLALQPGAMDGRLTYARWFVLRASAYELLAFAALFAFLAVLAAGWFFAGGALSCAWIAVRHLRLARKSRQAAEAPAA